MQRWDRHGWWGNVVDLLAEGKPMSNYAMVGTASCVQSPRLKYWKKKAIWGNINTFNRRQFTPTKWIVGRDLPWAFIAVHWRTTHQQQPTTTRVWYPTSVRQPPYSQIPIISMFHGNKNNKQGHTQHLKAMPEPKPPFCETFLFLELKASDELLFLRESDLDIQSSSRRH